LRFDYGLIILNRGADTFFQRIETTQRMEKFQIPRNKFQTCPPIGVINFGDQIFGMSSATVLFGIWGLRIEVYLGFGV
jgi:hypothetical protein